MARVGKGKIELIRVRRTHPTLLEMMPRHYSAPKGFVGRNLCYLIEWAPSDLAQERRIYGAIVGGSATRFLPGRVEFFGGKVPPLNSIINNTFFHAEPGTRGYPCRNFVPQVIALWRARMLIDWPAAYGDAVAGFETLVELPRTGECYRRDGWALTGQTKGFTCKRVAGKGSDSWTGKRVWDTVNLRPKLVFMRLP
jgi:hypothetical protein